MLHVWAPRNVLGRSARQSCELVIPAVSQPRSRALIGTECRRALGEGAWLAVRSWERRSDDGHGFRRSADRE